MQDIWFYDGNAAGQQGVHTIGYQQLAMPLYTKIELVAPMSMHFALSNHAVAEMTMDWEIIQETIRSVIQLIVGRDIV
ncbi:hypothetical protein [Paenibacillus sp. B2(2019)]|uniref:hypothetical protein n=1 Tax=Paenibacillus sp. B2(2019) TaxID=2607754 RepID=UPI0021CE42B9|nr:hypothetical protein [Paenibacillus sp. B2(2019)]